MKKSITLSVLALATLALAGRQASAWTEFKLGVGVGYSQCNGFALGGLLCYTRVPCCCPSCYAPVLGGGLPYDGAGYGDYGGFGGYFVNPTHPVSTDNIGQAGNFQTVDFQGLGYGAGPYQPINYGYDQGSSYWYGR